MDILSAAVGSQHPKVVKKAIGTAIQLYPRAFWFWYFSICLISRILRIQLSKHGSSEHLVKDESAQRKDYFTSWKQQRRCESNGSQVCHFVCFSSIATKAGFQGELFFDSSTGLTGKDLSVANIPPMHPFLNKQELLTESNIFVTQLTTILQSNPK